MKLPLFLKEVDGLTAGASHDELEWFIHEAARTLPEEKRNHFLNTLKSISRLSKSGEAGSQGIVVNNDCQELLKEIETIHKKLAEINEGVRCLDSEYNDEWDDWYNSDVPEVLFTDPLKILPDINQAMTLIHSCIDREAYKEGCELAEVLSFLEVSAEGDYADCNGSPLSMCDLSENELLMHDFRHFIKECLYLTYMGNTLENRADEIFCMIGNFNCFDIGLEDILQSGNMELPQFEEFLTLWISYLGVQEGRYAEKFLKEAQEMIQDEQVLLENARKFVDVHPGLYEQLLRQKLASGEDEKMLQIGREALAQIPSSYKIRSEIALLSAEYAGHLNRQDEVESCWLKAFRSDSTAVNYLRIRLGAGDWSQYQEEVKSIYEQVYKETKGKTVNTMYSSNAHKENCLYEKEYCIMLFFGGQLDRLLTVGMSEKNALGWSSTFMKEGLALILLLLYEGSELPAGLKAMLNKAASACGFTSAEYYRGTGNEFGGSDIDMFWQLFNQWKENIEISENEISHWIDRVEQWIAHRVAGIMERSHRNYYGECASYIAALGEVQESLGNPFAKLHIMEQYKAQYSRRSAFHQELRAYGMKDKKKK